MDKFNQLKDLVQGIESDARRFFIQGNKSAGTRVRKAMQEIKNVAQEVRIEISERKNAE